MEAHGALVMMAGVIFAIADPARAHPTVCLLISA
jgi:hypothetical protein